MRILGDPVTRGWVQPVVVAAMVLGSLAAAGPVRAQVSGLAVGVTPVLPSSVAVAAQNRPAGLVIANQSVGAPFSSQNVQLGNIRLNLSCNAVPGAVLCPQAEPRPVAGLQIFAIDGVPVGRAGTACAGTAFAVSAPDATGTVVLTPPTPVVLGSSSVGGTASQCVVDFVFDVLQRPLDGTTRHVAMVDAQTASASYTASGAGGQTQVTEASPRIASVATPQVVREGATFSGTAVVSGVSGGPALSGAVVLRLYRSQTPAFPDCTGTPFATATVAATPTVAEPGTGAPRAVATFTIAPAPPPGNYTFVDSYDEAGTDVNYGPAASGCTDASGRVTVTPNLPGIVVTKTPGTIAVNEPGGPVVFTVTVGNTGPGPVTLTSLVDDRYGNLNGQGSCAVASAASRPPTTPLIAPSGTYTCSFTGQVPFAGTGMPGQSQVDVVTARVTDANGYVATDSDDATVAIVGVAPVIALIHDAGPLSMSQPGGTFTHEVRVRNDSAFESVTINSLTDNVYGNVATLPSSTCGSLVGSVLAAGATSPTCSFGGDFTGVTGSTLTDVLTVSVVDDDGQTATAGAATTVAITAGVGPRYFPLSPTRIEDTRFGSGGLTAPVGPGETAQVQVTGRAGVPAEATAVVLNVTVTQPTADGYLTLYPAGSARPLAATLNFALGRTVPNLAVVKLGMGGRVALFNPAGATQVILDVAGYYADIAGNAGHYQSLVPARIADTRIGVGGVRLGPGESFDLQVTGKGGAPASGVSAAVLNVAVTEPTASSFLTVYPTGEARPLAANLNFTTGETVSNRTITKLGTGGKVTVYNAAGSTDVVVDIGGTYTDASAVDLRGTYTALAPSRILDTRFGVGAAAGVIPAGGFLELQVAGRGGVPDTNVRAVVLNVAVTGPIGFGFLTVFPTGELQPVVSDLNYAPLETRANLVVVQLGASGKVTIYTPSQAHVVVDVAGWFN